MVAMAVRFLAIASMLVRPQARAALITDDPAPGTPAGVVFKSFDWPAIDGQGHVAVKAILSGPGITIQNDDAIYVGPRTAPILAAREGSSSPIPGINYGGLGLPIANSAGQIFFNANLQGAGVTFANNAALFAGTPGALTKVARLGDVAPDTTPNTFIIGYGGLQGTFFNDSAEVAFTATLGGPDVTGADYHALYVGLAASPHLLARMGTPAPAEGSNYDGFVSLALNDHGHVAFQSALTGPTATNRANFATMPANPNVLLVARKGYQAPDVPAQIKFDFLNAPTINNAGHVAFNATLIGAVTPANNAGIWEGSPEQLNIVARAGDQAPGLPLGVTYGTLFSTPLLSNQTITFVSNLAGATPETSIALFTGSPIAVSALIRAGDPLPGTPAGVGLGPIYSLLANSGGQVAFRAGLTGDGVTSANDIGVWATDVNGKLVFVAREGQAIDLGLGQPLVITDIGLWSLTGGEDGRPTSFNDDGQLAFAVTFSSIIAPGAASGPGISAGALPPTLSGVLVVNIPDPSLVAPALFLFARYFAGRRRAPRPLQPVEP
jgi:hypothetical protein